MMQTFRVLGLMSGTSLDGLDLALADFTKESDSWKFDLIAAETVNYSEDWVGRLRQAVHGSALEITRLDVEYGHLLGRLSSEFLQRNRLEADLVASHGHTIFHRPDEGFTLQIGNGNALASHHKCPVVFDFRALDVCEGGQGAPLVPFGDFHLFSDYAGCLNIGGFANVSVNKSLPMAWDICPANYVLNFLANKLGYSYDNEGQISRSGSLIQSLLLQLESNSYYQRESPKSLGSEFVMSDVFPLFNSYSSIPDLLRTYTEHIAKRIATDLKNINGAILTTGGGAKNSFLIERIECLSDRILAKPSVEIIDFKEAIVFAFLGLLRHLNLPNIDGRITGSNKFLSSGNIVLSPQ
ncbi:MAG: anhydro-N-acetylmuramic acid kinase [Bacteroidales bacterium]|nr:anhydro-N-acetylmuramic acid kinase [Bacteroidales bacterium]